MAGTTPGTSRGFSTTHPLTSGAINTDETQAYS